MLRFPSIRRFEEDCDEIAAAAAARMIRPKILYPCHFGETDTSRIVELLRDREETEVRIRLMQ